MRTGQDIIDDFREVVKPQVARILFDINHEGCGKLDKAEFETEFELILTLAEIGLGKRKVNEVTDDQTRSN